MLCCGITNEEQKRRKNRKQRKRESRKLGKDVLICASRRAIFVRERVLRTSPKILDKHIDRVSNLSWR